MKQLKDWLRDIAHIFIFRIKLICKDMTTLAALLFSLLIFTLVLTVLSGSAQEHSAIPIGIVDKDQSRESAELMVRVAETPALRVIEGEEEELHELLLDEMVNALFVIEEGYGRKIWMGDSREIITMYYIRDNKSSSIISDIIAGEMIYPISLYKSLRYYERLPFDGGKLTAEEYGLYVDHLLKESDDFDFAFHMILENPRNEVRKEEPISNALLYNQLIFGILGILTALIAMFLISGLIREKELGVEERLSISRIHYWKQEIGNLLALLFVEGMVALILTGILCYPMEPANYSIYISSFLLVFLFATAFGSLFLLIAGIVKSILVYQMVGSILILVTGGLGFYHLLTGFYQVISGSIVKIIPNCWFIQGFTDIIVYGTEGGILTEGHRGLLSITVILFILVLLWSSIRGRIRISLNIRKHK